MGTFRRRKKAEQSVIKKRRKRAEGGDRAKFEKGRVANIRGSLFFGGLNLDWIEIYLLPRKVTLDSYSHSFQCKILNNIIFLNKKNYVWELQFTNLFFLQTV